MEHKKFMDIERLKESYANGFQSGDHILVQEKIDGANAAIRYSTDTEKIIAQSRKNILSFSNNLRGFWEWTQTLNKQLIKKVLGDQYVLFGEWLVPHSVKYPDERYNHFYAYDVYDIINQKYLPQDKVKEIIEYLGLTYVPVFYDGEFIS